MTKACAQRSHPGESLESVRVADAMHHGVVTCRPAAPLSAVARLMAAHRIHAVVVADERDGSGWGLVSDLDLAAAVCDGFRTNLTAGEMAAKPGLFVRPDETVAHAAQLMRDYNSQHLIVLGRGSERPVGIVSTLDLADVVAELPRPCESERNGSES